MNRVVVVEVAADPDRNLDIEREILGPDVELVHYIHDNSDSQLISICSDADAILTDYAPFSRSVISELECCRVISVAATGYDCVDLAAAADANINVCAIDEYCTDEVADHTLLLMLAVSRRLTEYHDQVQSERRWQFDSLSGLRRMRGMTLGIIGFGKIGQAVALRARAFGLTVIAYDPYADAGTENRDLPTLLAESDIVSLHCGLSSDKQHMLDENAFQEMIRKPILINCARGGLIDESALLAALDDGLVSGAGLDVLSDENPNLGASPFLGRRNVILTPHVAFYSDASMRENREISAANIRHCLDGEHAAVRRYIYQS